jgi:hypothetical protein
MPRKQFLNCDFFDFCDWCDRKTGKWKLSGVEITIFYYHVYHKYHINHSSDKVNLQKGELMLIKAELHKYGNLQFDEYNSYSKFTLGQLGLFLSYPLGKIK